MTLFDTPKPRLRRPLGRVSEPGRVSERRLRVAGTTTPEAKPPVRHLLPDGTPLVIRPIRPEDAASEQAFVRGLSSESRRRRFLGALTELSPAMLDRFTRIDPDREAALVAFAGDDARARQVGVARYAIEDDGRTAEFALVVGDEHQHQGVGRRLMELLLDVARAHGVGRMRGEVLADNAAMLGLMGRLGFIVRAHPRDGAMMLVERPV